MNQYEIVKNIYNKVAAKNPLGTLNSVWTKSPNTQYTVRIYPTRERLQGNEHDPNQTALYKLVSMVYATNCQQNLASCVRFLNFNTEQERHNAWQSYLTKFARFCICMDESTKLAPYMDDYTEPWTDERFKQYFGLTDIEWQLIDTVIKD